MLNHSVQNSEETHDDSNLLNYVNSVNANSLAMRPIGHLHSAFRDRRGTPRQGCLVPHSTAFVEFSADVNAVSALDGLDEFSHVWVLGWFHENTNVGKTGGIATKIKPPRLQGTKVGIYSTRTPHRHNPISLSLARIDRIESTLSKGKTVTRLWLSGIDLIHCTPILDIKPYIPEYDAASGEVMIAKWVAEEDKQVGFRFDNVIIPEPLVEKYNACISDKLEFYTPDKFLEAVKEILTTDIRSDFQRKLHKSEEMSNQAKTIYNFRLDVVTVMFIVEAVDTIVLQDLALS